MMKYLLLLPLTLLFIACNKDSNQTNSNKDWNVRYEVVSTSTHPKLYIQWSNGVSNYYTGTTSDNTTWPVPPWTKDTVFKAADGNRMLGLNVVSIMDPNINEMDIISRVYINGVKEKEVKGMNQFLKISLK